MAMPEEQKRFALDYIAKHPHMDARTKTLLAEVVKGELSKPELVDLALILMGVHNGL